MICDDFADNLELYALGVLEKAEASALTDHLATGCSICYAGLQQALDQNRAVSMSVPLVAPPARLRRRVRGAIAPVPYPRREWLPRALLATFAVVAILIGFSLQSRLRHQNEVAEAQFADYTRLTRALRIIRAPGTRELPLADPKIPDLRGAVYIHGQLGIALVMDHLPRVPDGWHFESWLVPKTGIPHPIEPFDADRNGYAVSMKRGPLEIPDIGAVAVSMEPKGVAPTKPTRLLFAVRL